MKIEFLIAALILLPCTGAVETVHIELGDDMPDPIHMVIFKLPDGGFTGFWKMDSGEWVPLSVNNTTLGGYGWTSSPFFQSA